MTKKTYESTMLNTRITPVLLVLLLTGTFVAAAANAGPTQTRFDSNRGVFARWFKKAPLKKSALEHLIGRWNGACVPWQDEAMRLSIPEPVAIIVITESEGDSTNGEFTDSVGPSEIDAISREESNSDGDSSDDTILTDDTHYSHGGIGRMEGS